MVPREPLPIDPDIAELMDSSTQAARRVVDPDINALLNEGLEQDQASTLNSPETEDKRNVFEKDYANFLESTSAWKHEFAKQQLIPTADDIPAAYVFRANTTFSPYGRILCETIELKSRGSPLIVCAQPQAPSMDDAISVYFPGKYSYPFIAEVADHPASRLASAIGGGRLHSFMFDPEWRKSKLAQRTLVDYGILWAEKQGIAQRAFMTSNLIKGELYDYTQAETTDITQKSRDLYEELASKCDENGQRIYFPLGPEEFAGLVTGAMNDVYRLDPEFNELAHLTRPF